MNKKRIPLAIGILSMNLLLMSTSVVGAAIAAIAKSFPREPISKVQMLSTIPQLGQVIATLIFTWLTYRMTRKNVSLLAILFVIIGGLIPAFYNNSLNIILACMIAIGFGTGLISNVGPVLLQEHFEGEERATVMGWSVGFNNVGMMAFTAIGSALGSSDWRNLFWIYAIGVVIFLITYFMVPQDTRLKREKNNAGKASTWATLKNINKLAYIYLLITFFTSIAITMFMANQSIVLAGKGMGTGYTGLVTAIGNIGGILTAAFLGKIRKFTKNYTIAYGFIAFALSFVFVLFFDNIAMHIVGNMFSGIGIVLINATIPFQLSNLADKSEFLLVISMNTLISSIAGALAPILLAALHLSVGVNQFIAGIILSSAIAVLIFITRLGSVVDKATEK
ncbi:MFS transporter [Lactobacillus johnsonii]|uniref:MFS transporter n=1 Tax=Lactobacillus johnsonii TaxID=33959 RepID=UPI0028E6840D|nr:MFS transporter [Lactobacillus johnsonii]MDT9605753.1 MFS transporter [Lactobacillus johnsonii]